MRTYETIDSNHLRPLVADYRKALTLEGDAQIHAVRAIKMRLKPMIRFGKGFTDDEIEALEDLLDDLQVLHRGTADLRG